MCLTDGLRCGVVQIVWLLIKSAKACKSEWNLDRYDVMMHLALSMFSDDHIIGTLITGDELTAVKSSLQGPVSLAAFAYQLVPPQDESVSDSVGERKLELPTAVGGIVGGAAPLVHSSTRSDATSVPFMMALGPDGLVVAFRGTHNFSDMCIDARALPLSRKILVRGTNFAMQVVAGDDFRAMCLCLCGLLQRKCARFHSGVWATAEHLVACIMTQLHTWRDGGQFPERFNQVPFPITTTGHSLGGGVAQLVAAMMHGGCAGTFANCLAPSC